MGSGLQIADDISIGTSLAEAVGYGMLINTWLEKLRRATPQIEINRNNSIFSVLSSFSVFGFSTYRKYHEIL
jgi:hypothetical protein